MTTNTLIALLFLALAFSVGCGGTQQQRTAHEALNMVVDVADPTYQMAVDTCRAARHVIIDRQGTTYEEDRAAFDSIHEICDPMVAGFEVLRGVVITARVAIDTGDIGDTASQGIAEALQLWSQLRRLLPQLATLGR